MGRLDVFTQGPRSPSALSSVLRDDPDSVQLTLVGPDWRGDGARWKRWLRARHRGGVDLHGALPGDDVARTIDESDCVGIPFAPRRSFPERDRGARARQATRHLDRDRARLLRGDRRRRPTCSRSPLTPRRSSAQSDRSAPGATSFSTPRERSSRISRSSSPGTASASNTSRSTDLSSQGPDRLRSPTASS